MAGLEDRTRREAALCAGHIHGDEKVEEVEDEEEEVPPPRGTP